MTDPPTYEAARCTGCGRCVAACPRRILSLEPSGFRKIVVRAPVAECGACRECAAACLFRAWHAPDDKE